MVDTSEAQTVPESEQKNPFVPRVVRAEGVPVAGVLRIQAQADHDPAKVDRTMRDMEMGRTASQLLEYSADTLARMDAEVDLRVYQKIQQGEPVSHEFALQAWMEKYALHALVKRLGQAVKAGKSASESARKFLS